MPGRFQRAADAMDENAWDYDRRMRFGSLARGESAFLTTLLGGRLGWIVGLVCLAALAAVLVWVFA